MKKKVAVVLCLLIITAGICWLLLREEKLPEPSQASLDYIASEFDGLTLEESAEKIQQDKERFEFFSRLSRADDLYNERTQIQPSDESYKKGYSVLSAEEYKTALDDVINTLSFSQKLYHNYSFIHFDIKEMPSKQQPVVKIRNITYMDGSVENRNEKLDGTLRLDTHKTVKNITADITYYYINELVSYSLTADNTAIIQPDFTLKLAEKDRNYLSYTLEGDLVIGGEDITDKNGKILSFSSCVRGEIGFNDKMKRFVDGAVKASDSQTKEQLIHKVAAYYQRFERETDEPDTYRVACLYHGTPVAVTVYAIKDKAGEARNTIITPKYTELYPVVGDEKTKVFYIIDQNGNEILNNGKNRPYSLTADYFFTKAVETKKDDDGYVDQVTHYQLHKLDVKNKKSELITDMDSVFSLSDDAFVIGKENEILLFNTMNEKPFVFSGKNLRIRTLEFPDGQSGFFYYEDKQGYHIINDKGVTILPVTGYRIEKGGNNSLIFGPGFFIEDKIKTADKTFYFLNPEGDIFLTLTGYDKAEGFSDNMIHVQRNRLHGFTDSAGHEVIPLVYNNVRNFDNGYALAEKDDHWGVINKQGDVVIPFKYSRHNSRSSFNGLVSYTIDDKDYTMQELLAENGINTDKITAAEH